MATFFLACFIIGFALTAIAFLTGAAGHSLGDFWDAGDAGDLGHGGDAGDAGDGGGKGFGLVNFGTVTAFLTWFGGIGFLLTAYSTVVAAITVGFAIMGGLAGAGMIFLFMAKVLAPDQIPMRASDYHLPGVLGRVAVTIPAEGTGEVVYTQGGTRKTVAARGTEGQGIEKGTEVVVLRYERGIAYVRPWDQMAEGGPQGPAV